MICATSTAATHGASRRPGSGPGDEPDEASTLRTGTAAAHRCFRMTPLTGASTRVARRGGSSTASQRASIFAVASRDEQQPSPADAGYRRCLKAAAARVALTLAAAGAKRLRRTRDRAQTTTAANRSLKTHVGTDRLPKAAACPAGSSCRVPQVVATTATVPHAVAVGSSGDRGRRGATA